MGNELAPASKLGITSISLTTPNIEIAEISKLLSELRTLSKAKNSEFIDKAELDGVLKMIEKLEPADLELFNKLFTLFDMKGDGTVNFRDYVAGICGSMVSGKINERLKFALSVYDDNANDLCLKGDVKRTLHSINNTASYFGDPVLVLSEIDEIILSLFAAVPKVTGQYVSHEAVIDFLVEHPLVQMFVRGEGKARFGLME